MDQHGALKRNDDHWTLAEELRGAQDPTQVGQALQALGIEAIYALSPQAKGRVERLWGTLQDRLVSELRLAGARTAARPTRCWSAIARSTTPLRGGGAGPAPAWRPLRRGLDLDRALQLPLRGDRAQGQHRAARRPRPRYPAGAAAAQLRRPRVVVHQLLDGTWRVYAGTQLIATAAATSHRELRALKRRKRSRGAPASLPEYAAHVEIAP